MQETTSQSRRPLCQVTHAAAPQAFSHLQGFPSSLPILSVYLNLPKEERSQGVKVLWRRPHCPEMIQDSLSSRNQRPRRRVGKSWLNGVVQRSGAPSIAWRFGRCEPKLHQAFVYHWDGHGLSSSAFLQLLPNTCVLTDLSFYRDHFSPDGVNGIWKPKLFFHHPHSSKHSSQYIVNA